MRWDRLFADLEAQLDELERDEFTTEVVDRTQREQALIRLADRLRAAEGETIEVRLIGGERVSGSVGVVGADWLTICTNGVAVVPLGGVSTVHGIPPRGVTSGSEVTRRLDLGYAVRLLMREGVPVLVNVREGGLVRGTIVAVGADYVELNSDHDHMRVMVPFANVTLLRSCG